MVFKPGKCLEVKAGVPELPGIPAWKKELGCLTFQLRKNHNKNYSVVKFQEETPSEVIKTFQGPEYELLSVSEKNMLEKSHFSIGSDSNRMGIQLEGQVANDLKPIITSPVLPGTVQLTPSGTLIVLMRDCQTTGGYPRVLQLSEDGINALAQKLPGEKVKFQILK